MNKVITLLKLKKLLTKSVCINCGGDNDDCSECSGTDTIWYLSDFNYKKIFKEK